MSPAPSRPLTLLDPPPQLTPHLRFSFLTHKGVGGKKRLRKVKMDLVSKQQIKNLQVAKEPRLRECNDVELERRGNEPALGHTQLRSLLCYREVLEQKLHRPQHTQTPGSV